MTSRKSFQNNAGFTFRSGLREGSLLAVLLAVLPSLIVYIEPFSTFLGTTYDHKTGLPIIVDFTKEYSFLFFDKDIAVTLVLIASLLVTGVVMAVLMFRFITNKKTVNVYYSLGITRAKLFSAKYLAGLMLLFAAVALPLIVVLIVNISVLGTNKFMISAFFYLLLGNFSIAAFSFSATSAVISSVGTMFEGILFSSVVMVFPEIFLRSLQVFIEKFVFGSPLGQIFTDSYYSYSLASEELVNEFTSVNPLRYMLNGLLKYSYALPKGKMEIASGDTATTVDWISPNFLVPVIWLAVAAAVFALGCYLFRRRKAEIAGFIGTNKPLNFVMSFIVATTVFALLFGMLTDSTDLSNALSMIIGGAVFIVVYCVINLILLRDIREFVKQLRGLPIQAALLGVLLIFFGTGYFGTANRIPKTEDIASAQITMPYFSEYPDSTIYEYQSIQNGLRYLSTTPRGNYTTENDINFVRNIHELIVKTGRVKASVMDNEFNGIYPESVKITYKLKNGKEIKRYYYGMTQEVLDALEKCDNTDFRKASLKKIFKDPVVNPIKNLPDNKNPREAAGYGEFKYIYNVRSETSSVCLYQKTLSDEIPLELDSEQRAKLLDCLYQDLLELTPESHYNPDKTLGVISFLCSIEEENDGGTFNGDVYVMPDEYVDGDGPKFSGKYFDSNSSMFVITPEMKRTVELIKSLGYYDEMTAEKEIEKVNIVKVSDNLRDWDKEGIKYKRDFWIEFLSFSERRSPKSNIFYLESESTIKTVTDKKAINELYPVTVSRGKVLPNDYLVEIVFKDGMHSVMFVHENEMPKSVLSLIK